MKINRDSVGFLTCTNQLNKQTEEEEEKSFFKIKFNSNSFDQN